jgi:prepilin-type N-terminal cleavage/methylation domain-containing protein
MGVKGHRGGFTLVELMAVVVIVGALATVAIPTFTNQIRRSRTTEAVLQVGRLWNAALTYYDTQHLTDDGVLIEHVFPATAAPTPAALPSSRPYPPDGSQWNTPTWNALNFSLPSPHWYQYTFLNLQHCMVPEGSGPAFEDGGLFNSPGGPLEGYAPSFVRRCPNQNQVYVCKQQGNAANPRWRTLTVGAPAALAAGDYDGVCQGDQTLEDGFYALAAGNLDGDDEYSYFYRGAMTLTGGAMIRMTFPTAVDPLE